MALQKKERKKEKRNKIPACAWILSLKTPHLFLFFLNTVLRIENMLSSERDYLHASHMLSSIFIKNYRSCSTLSRCLIICLRGGRSSMGDLHLFLPWSFNWGFFCPANLMSIGVIDCQFCFCCPCVICAICKILEPVKILVGLI